MARDPPHPPPTHTHTADRSEDDLARRQSAYQLLCPLVALCPRGPFGQCGSSILERSQPFLKLLRVQSPSGRVCAGPLSAFCFLHEMGVWEMKWAPGFPTVSD